MRAIIIEEERFVEIVDLLRSECVSNDNNGYLKMHTSLTDDQIKFAKEEMFRTFNMHFIRWAQSHGARCVR